MATSLEAHLDQLLRRHAELRDALAGTGLAGTDIAKSSKEYSELTPIVDGIEKLRRARDELSSLDPAMSASDNNSSRARRNSSINSTIGASSLYSFDNLVKLAPERPVPASASRSSA